MKKMYGFSLLTISLVALVVVAFMDIPVHRQYVAAFVPIIGMRPAVADHLRLPQFTAIQHLIRECPSYRKGGRKASLFLWITLWNCA